MSFDWHKAEWPATISEKLTFSILSGDALSRQTALPGEGGWWPERERTRF